MNLKHVTLVIAFMLFVFVTCPVHGVKVELKETFNFSPQTEKPKVVKDFCVIDDGLIIISDYGAGNLKVYESNKKSLELIQTIGYKGYGPNGFIRPSVCSYSREENRFVVLDIGIRKIFIYNRMGRTDFERDPLEILCWRGAFDLQLKNGRVFISGYAEDNAKNGYDFYYVDLKNGKKSKYLLTPSDKFGISLPKDQNYFVTSIIPLGVKGWFDLKDDVAYFVWEANSRRIIEIDTNSGTVSKIFPKTLLASPTESLAPKIIAELDDLRKNDDLIQYEKKRVKALPIVRNLFITKNNNVLLIVEGPFLGSGESSFQAQLFTNRDLKGTVLIPSMQPNSNIFYDKTEGCLWALSNDSILQYRVIE